MAARISGSKRNCCSPPTRTTAILATPPSFRCSIDHVTIRRDAARVDAGAPIEVLHRLGVQLAAHVRLEERDVFPLVEATLPEEALDALGDRLAAAAQRERERAG